MMTININAEKRFPHPAFTRLITYPSALAQLGFNDAEVWSGFVTSKPPHSPQVYWHQDGVLWNYLISYSKRPYQYFLMYWYQ